MKKVRIEFEVSEVVAKIIKKDMEWDKKHNNKLTPGRMTQYNDSWWRYILPGDMAIDTYNKLHNPTIEILEGEK